MRMKWHSAGEEILSWPFLAVVHSRTAGECSDSCICPFFCPWLCIRNAEVEAETMWKWVAPIVLCHLPPMQRKANALKTSIGLWYKTCCSEGANLRNIKLYAKPHLAELSLPGEKGKSLCSYVKTKINPFCPAFIYPFLTLWLIFFLSILSPASSHLVSCSQTSHWEAVQCLQPLPEIAILAGSGCCGWRWDSGENSSPKLAQISVSQARLLYKQPSVNTI